MGFHLLQVSTGGNRQSHGSGSGVSICPRLLHVCRPMKRRRGYANRFRLHCALHPESGRMFVHASEILKDGSPLEDNIQVMGLQVDRYCHQNEEGKATSWNGNVLGGWKRLVDTIAILHQLSSLPKQMPFKMKRCCKTWSSSIC